MEGGSAAASRPDRGGGRRGGEAKWRGRRQLGNVGQWLGPGLGRGLDGGDRRWRREIAAAAVGAAGGGGGASGRRGGRRGGTRGERRGRRVLRDGRIRTKEKEEGCVG
jgi:hypothetical protein